MPGSHSSSPGLPTVSWADQRWRAVTSVAPCRLAGLDGGLGHRERERRLAAPGGADEHDVAARERGGDGLVGGRRQPQPLLLGGGADRAGGDERLHRGQRRDAGGEPRRARPRRGAGERGSGAGAAGAGRGAAAARARGAGAGATGGGSRRGRRRRGRWRRRGRRRRGSTAACGVAAPTARRPACAPLGRGGAPDVGRRRAAAARLAGAPAGAGSAPAARAAAPRRRTARRPGRRPRTRPPRRRRRGLRRRLRRGRRRHGRRRGGRRGGCAVYSASPSRAAPSGPSGLSCPARSLSDMWIASVRSPRVDCPVGVSRRSSSISSMSCRNRV